MAHARSGLNQPIYEKAVGWLVRHRTGTLGILEKNAFDAWLRASPEHIRAYFEISALWEGIDQLDQGSGASAAELIERAKMGAPVVPISEKQRSRCEQEHIEADSHPIESLRPAAPPRFPYRSQIAAVVLVLCLAVGLLAWWIRRPTYSTGIGEQQFITLADGSTVQLNARSAIRVHFLEHERDIDLVRGQALFHVAKDPARAFIVRAGGTFVRAVGTQFDVNELRAGTVVTVLEGVVAVFGAQERQGMESTPPSNTDASRKPIAAELLRDLHGVRPIFLSSGEQLTMTAKSPAPEPVHVNAATATAWTQHRFIFDAAPLAEVVDEFNRYNSRQLVIADPQLDSFRINGFFSSTDPSLLLEFLRSQPEIVIDNTGDEIRILKKTP